MKKTLFFLPIALFFLSCNKNEKRNPPLPTLVNQEQVVGPLREQFEQMKAQAFLSSQSDTLNWIYKSCDIIKGEYKNHGFRPFKEETKVFLVALDDESFKAFLRDSALYAERGGARNMVYSPYKILINGDSASLIFTSESAILNRSAEVNSSDFIRESQRCAGDIYKSFYHNH